MSKRLAEWDQIRELAFYGLTCSAISQKVRLDVNKVSQCVIRMRRKGYLPTAKKNQNPLEKKKSIISSYQSAGIKRGCLGQIIENLTEDQINWLFKNSPQGGTVADFIRSIVVDTYLDETSE